MAPFGSHNLGEFPGFRLQRRFFGADYYRILKPVVSLPSTSAPSVVANTDKMCAGASVGSKGTTDLLLLQRFYYGDVHVVPVLQDARDLYHRGCIKEEVARPLQCAHEINRRWHARQAAPAKHYSSGRD